MTTAYPLHWPLGTARNKTRVSSRFNTSTSGAVKNVMDELRRFGNDTGRRVENLVISSNVTLVVQKPADPGVACYFRWDNIDCCVAVDRYPTPADNLQAIAKVIEAERSKMRHGGLNIVRASFRGFAALPPPTDAAGQLAPPWWDILGLPQNAALPDVERRWRELVGTHHPDKGGDAAKFVQVTEAVRQAREALRG